jgi:hypothetical protein
MLKYHKFISFCFGLVFLIVVQKFATPEPVFRFLLPAFLAYTAAAYLYNRWYLKKIDRYNFWLLLRIVLLLCTAFGMFLIIPSEFLRGLFLVIAVALITLFEIILGNLSENLLLNETLIIAFGLFITLTAFYEYVPVYATWYLAAAFLAGTLLARSLYEFVPQPQTAKLIGSLVLGLFVSEVFWGLNFLPFHFSVLGLMLFNLFYFCLILNYYRLFHILSFQKIQFHLVLIAACDTAVLLATRWRIIA